MKKEAVEKEKEKLAKVVEPTADDSADVKSKKEKSRRKRKAEKAAA